ncbi:MAG: hypothetical protein R2843_05770 [Thermomicrobiales bacterium]
MIATSIKRSKNSTISSRTCRASTRSKRGSRASASRGSGYFNVAGDISRRDLASTDCDAKFDGHRVGNTYEQLRDQHLDLWNVDKVLLTGASTYLCLGTARS